MRSTLQCLASRRLRPRFPPGMMPGFAPAFFFMSQIELILTHPGGAHKDELLACSVLLALHPVPLVRREPAAEDLANPTTAVVDVGHLHEPARNNFDHHQLPKDQIPTCSLSLVLQHLGLYEDARQFCDWLEAAEWFDFSGPVTT